MIDIEKRLYSAEQAIEAQQYSKARHILEDIDDPRAKQLLAELNAFVPPQRQDLKVFALVLTLLLATGIILVIILFRQVNAVFGSDSIFFSPTEEIILPTATALPLIDPLGLYIRDSLAGIERIEHVTPLQIPGRDEVQYDMTMRIYENVDLYYSLDSVSVAIWEYQQDATTHLPPSITVTVNMTVLQGAKSETWRFTGSEWVRRAIDGLAVTATPYPTPLPNSNTQPQNSVTLYQTNYIYSSSSTNYGNYGSRVRTPRDCEEAHAMGLTPEQAARWPHLDRDGDGVACPYNNPFGRGIGR